MEITDIRVFKEYKGKNKGKYTLYNRSTGKTLLMSGVYDTEEAANEAIPREHKQQLKIQADLAEVRKAAEAEMRRLEAAEASWENKNSAYQGYEEGRGYYTTTRDGGRRYANLPGAVHYDNGDGPLLRAALG